MKKISILLSVMLICGHLFTETSEIFEKVFPQLKSVYIKPWISSAYVFPDENGINILWWIYYCTNDFLWILTFFVAAMIAAEHSFRMFRVCCVFFIYHIFDHFMLWWNYKTGHLAYWLLMAAIISAIVFMFLPEKKRGVVKYME